VLRELHIKDFAIIDELHLRLSPGFNVLTGETGAGKSILIDAISLLLGGRADISAIRAGESRARIEGLFVLEPTQRVIIDPILKREGIEGEDPDVLWLSRELRDSGRSVARVNGSMVSLRLMRSITEGLVDIHGQSEHLSLLRVKEHLSLLDRFAGLETLRAKLATTVRKLQSVQRELRNLRQSERERMQRIDLLRFQVREIRAAELRADEKEELEQDLIRLSNAERLSTLTSDLLTLLGDGTSDRPSVSDLIGKAEREMLALVRIDATLTPQAELLESLGYQLEDLTRTLQDYLADVEFSPKRLTRVEERLRLLRQLERKYGRDLGEVLAYAEHADAELKTLERSDESIAELEIEQADLQQEAAELCLELSQKRRAAVLNLSAGVDAELADLNMQGARFGVAFRWEQDQAGLPLPSDHVAEVWITQDGEMVKDVSPVTEVAFDITGVDRLEFLVAPNVGEGLKPMVRIASGGETARLMLALKTVLSRADRTPTLIFDEIDQGIGGRVGGVVGAKLWRLTAPDQHTDAADSDSGLSADGVQHQVLCVTHLPQLASFGDTHYRVEKAVLEGRTLTRVKRLNADARLSELAQMLGGYGEAAHKGAQDILTQADKLKQAKEDL
jgi:DNA repair protein RecN (Recombination protein N)